MRISGRALFVDDSDVELLANLTMLPNATIIVVVSSLSQVQNRWSFEVHVIDTLLSASLEIFLVYRHHIVGPGPVWENCNFRLLSIIGPYLKTVAKTKGSWFSPLFEEGFVFRHTPAMAASNNVSHRAC